jgi:hypothetical protein
MTGRASRNRCYQIPTGAKAAVDDGRDQRNVKQQPDIDGVTLSLAKKTSSVLLPEPPSLRFGGQVINPQ